MAGGAYVCPRGVVAGTLVPDLRHGGDPEYAEAEEADWAEAVRCARLRGY